MTIIMKINRIITAALLVASMMVANSSSACTNFLFTKGATKDG